jgi:hypothetical protein
MASGKPRPKTAPRPGRAAPAVEAPPPLPLLGAGLVIGLYAMLPAFFAGGIHLRKSVEMVDHVVPGVVVLALVVLAIMRQARPDTFMLLVGVGILLAGFWMAATHVGLASQAFNNQASTAGALYHCSTAVAVGGLAIAWVWRYRTAGEPDSDRRPGPAGRHS